MVGSNVLVQAKRPSTDRAPGPSAPVGARTEACRAALSAGELLLIQFRGEDGSLAARALDQLEQSGVLPSCARVAFNAADAEGLVLLNELGLGSPSGATLTVVIAPPGQVVGQLLGIPDAAALGRAVGGPRGGGRCPCGKR